ncbi:hypothetical protein [Diaphorobacter sp.]|uniref:hypothetical protein n=1 Tax=Diaphorobacter sp. TaxID=1934310 RepID=UPI002590EC1A|nr:hypothetical protein [Diaphorobacter sp.]
MKRPTFALLGLMLTLSAPHALAQDAVIGRYGHHVYVMVPTDKAGNRAYVQRAAANACEGKSLCHASVWAESLDRPEGAPPHPRYEENKLAAFQRNRNAGLEASHSINCRLFARDINVPCLAGTE